MKKQLIEKVNGEKQQYEALILKANRDILMYQEKLGRLEDGTDDERLKKVLNELKSKKNYIEGLIFLHKELEKNLRGLYKDDGSCTDIAFALAIKNNIKVNEDNLKSAYEEYYQLLRKKLVINCDNSGKRKELNLRIKNASKIASSLTEEEFIKRLIKIFRTNSFSNLYDSKDEYLNYSLGQIFLIKYAITQLSSYYDNYDYTPNMVRQIKILSNYNFKLSGKNLSYLDFANSLENGNLHLCDLNYPVLSYEGALKLYKHVAFTFFLPKQVGYAFKKSLK